MANAIGSLNTAPTGTASAIKQAVAGNFVDLRSAGWTQQYLPELMEQEAEVFGNRTISGFLSQVGAEEAMASDQVIWSEQGRLHVSAAGVIDASTGVITQAGHSVRLNDTVVINRAGVGTLKCLVIEEDTDTVYSSSLYTRRL